MQFESKYKLFHWRKYISNCRLHNGSHVVQVSLYQMPNIMTLCCTRLVHSHWSKQGGSAMSQVTIYVREMKTALGQQKSQNANTVLKTNNNKKTQLVFLTDSNIYLCMGSANERRGYSVTSSLIGWAHTQYELCISVVVIVFVDCALWYYE